MATKIEYARRKLARIGAPVILDRLGPEEFSGYASVFGTPDDSNDIVARGAFATSLRKRPPEKVRMLYQHFSHEPIGTWMEIREDGEGLFVHGRLVTQSVRGRDVMALIREGAVSGLSIGFRTIRATRDRARTYRILNEIDLWEISIVTFPLLKESQVLAVGARVSDLSEHIDAGRRIIT